MAPADASSMPRARSIAPDADRRAVLGAYERHINRGLAKIAALSGAPLEVRSEGSHVYDEHGRQYLDCGGYGVFLLGHCHPRIVEAVGRQLRCHPLSTRLLVDPRLAAAAETLAAVTPSGLDRVLFTNSGTEAIEVALKLARVNGHPRTVAMDNGFHGKTLGSLSVTGRSQYRQPFTPLLPEVEFVPYGDLAGLENTLVRPGPPASVLLEPVQAEGGVRLPPPGFLAAVRTLCDRYGALLLVDEVQSGLGRLGRWWGCDDGGLRPDVLCVGKILSGGVMPVGAAVASARLAEPLERDPLLHTSTFGGNPLAAVAATTTIEVLHEEGLVERAARLGALLLPAISDVLRRRCPQAVREVRGRGLLLGIEMASAADAATLMIGLLRRGVITSYSLNSHNVLRLTPPAILTDADVAWLIDALERAAAEVVTARPGNGSSDNPDRTDGSQGRSHPCISQS